MADAKKCDRCGRVYDAPTYVSDLRINRYTHPYGDRWYDLCSGCEGDLEKFLKNEDIIGRRYFI